MDHPGWYLVAYDIASPQRLKKIHRLLRQEGLVVQESLFFVRADEKSIHALLDRVAVMMQPHQDDLRAYPVTQPGEVWQAGMPAPALPLLHPGPADSVTGKHPRFKTWLRRLLHWPEKP